MNYLLAKLIHFFWGNDNNAVQDEGPAPTNNCGNSPDSSRLFLQNELIITTIPLKLQLNENYCLPSLEDEVVIQN
jgi:hypothetical protein